MNRNLISGIFILLLSFAIHAQEVEIGLRLEAQGLHKYYTFSKNSEFNMFPLPTCIQLTAGISPVNNLWIELRGGKEFAYSNFTGTEFGIFGKYFLYKSLYLTAGYAGHSNEGAGGRTSGSFSKRIYMPAAGFGIKPWNHIGIDVIYQKVNNESIGWSVNYKLIDSRIIEVTSLTRVDWLIKIGLTFDWIL